MTQTGPRGWHPGMIEHRFVDEGELDNTGPISFHRQNRTVDAVISMGSPVKRFYGTEILRIDDKSVILDRVRSNNVPLLDSHSQGSATGALGRIVDARIENGALVGKLKFNRTPIGEQAMNMVARGEISSLSAGYRVDRWEIADSEGRAVDQGDVQWDDENLTFTATKWELIEASLVSVPADNSAMIRSLGGDDSADFAATRARMLSRQRMVERMSAAFRRSR
jgi:HK97 family phage prohead protease